MAFFKKPLNRRRNPLGFKKRSFRAKGNPSYDAKCKPKSSDFRDFEFYSIEMVGGEKVMHISFSVWRNDGREDGDYTVTDYTFCYIPLRELVACKSRGARWELIMDYESEVHQYEGDYTWGRLVEEGYGYPGSPKQELDYGDITMSTPCGDYYCYY